MHLKSALILGGAGFIGTHLARQLSDLGTLRRIISLDIRQPASPVPRVIYNTHDIRRPLHETIDGHFDVVFNLAAVHRTPGHAADEYYETNVAGATNSVAFCERNGIDTLLFTSSISVYGPSEKALDESSPLLPNSAYGRSKKLAEEIHLAWLERAPGARRLRIVRPAVVFGEGENGNYTRLARLLRQGWFAYPGRKNTLKAGGYVKDLVRSMLFALDRRDPLYLYNFADRHCPTAEEICEAFSAYGMRRPIGVLPLPLMMAGALVFEGLNAVGLKNTISRARINKLVHSTNVVPRRLMADSFPFAYDLRSAISDWLATDETIRPAGTSARAMPKPPAPVHSSPTELVPQTLRASG
ncbi:MAG: NAD(P)-dependent oxidoreductase [Alphaproteobacteria bacterium]